MNPFNNKPNEALLSHKPACTSNPQLLDQRFQSN